MIWGKGDLAYIPAETWIFDKRGGYDKVAVPSLGIVLGIEVSLNGLGDEFCRVYIPKLGERLIMPNDLYTPKEKGNDRV